MTSARKLIRPIDLAQQRIWFLAFPYAVNKKFSDDQAGYLAALVSYYGFLSLFPLLLVLFTILGIVASNSPSLEHQVAHSALSQFPIIGNELGRNLHSLNRGSPVALVIGLIGLLWGAQGVAQAGQYAMAEVWHVPVGERFGFMSRVGRSFGVFAAVGLFLVVTSALAGFSTYGATTHALGMPARIGAGLISVIVNALGFLVLMRLLTPKQIVWRDLRLGAIVGGTAWTALQAVGGYLVRHQLRSTTPAYGFFGVVLGLLFFIYLAAEITMYATEANVVLARRLWPRALLQPPLTQADRDVLIGLVRKEERRPEERVSVTFGREHRDETDFPAPKSGIRRESR